MSLIRSPSFDCVTFLGIPVWVGRKLHTRYKGASKHKRNGAVMGGVAASVSRIFSTID